MKKIQKLRKAKSLSQTALAAKADCKQHQISRLEAGKAGVLPSTAERIAKVLGGDVTELFRHCQSETMEAK